ncbi:MAG: universal stress protein [Gammaproteobacteria bacterium]|nr:universal stress protein [Gammaproteobacteria bacterium]
MYNKILLCYDATEEGRRALRQGADIAAAMNADTFLLAICRSMLSTAVPEGVTPELIGCQESTARALLEEGVKWLNERGIRCEGALVFGNPFDHIPQTAQRIGADLIVLGTGRAACSRAGGASRTRKSCWPGSSAACW